MPDLGVVVRGRLEAELFFCRRRGLNVGHCRGLEGGQILRSGLVGTCTIVVTDSGLVIVPVASMLASRGWSSGQGGHRQTPGFSTGLFSFAWLADCHGFAEDRYRRIPLVPFIDMDRTPSHGGTDLDVRLRGGHLCGG
jgi:hypothetical protein